jgi:hypothetical protein
MWREQCPPLTTGNPRLPEFPVKSGGVGDPHAAFPQKKSDGGEKPAPSTAKSESLWRGHEEAAEQHQRVPKGRPELSPGCGPGLRPGRSPGYIANFV